MGFLSKITKPFSKVLDKIIPNEIKPILPFAAAAFPFLAPELFAGLGSLGGVITNPLARGAIGGGILNLGSQMAQEGYDKRGLNPLSLGLASLGGALAAPGSAGEISSLKSFTPGELQYASQIPSGSLEGGLFPGSSQLYGAESIGLTDPNLATTSSLQNLQNTGLNLAQRAAETMGEAQDLISQGDIFNKTVLTAAGPGQASAAGDLAYNKAKDLALQYEEDKKNLAALGQAQTSTRIDYITRAMKTAGFTDDEISDALKRSGFAIGGRVGYNDGSPKEGIKTIPLNLDKIAMNLFGDRFENLTYSQKETVYNDYYDRKDKKAKGGLMSLKGHEMDFRDGGGFVPIGKKERADDVPARLSKNEFVFTAKAVRGLGKGSTKEGAKKMYKLMKQYEALA